MEEYKSYAELAEEYWEQAQYHERRIKELRRKMKAQLSADQAAIDKHVMMRNDCLMSYRELKKYAEGESNGS